MQLHLDEITAAPGELMKQASMTAGVYMHEGIDRIDGTLGAGYAKKNPLLLSAFMITAALDYGAVIHAQQIRRGLKEVASSLGEFSECAEQLGCIADSVREGLHEVTEGIGDELEQARKDG